MAPGDLKNNKRKGASESAPKPKKMKSTDGAAVAPAKVTAPKEKKTKKTKAAASAEEPVVEAAAVVEAPKATAPKEKKTKKTKAAAPAEEPVVEAAAVVEAPKAKAKKGKKAKTTDEVEIGTPVVMETITVTEEIPFSRREKNATKTKDTPVAEKDTVVKKVKKAKKEDAAGAEADTVMTEANDSEDEGDLDDQTAALLAGFESDQDEDDVEKDAKFDEEAMDVPALTNKQRKELRKARNDSKPGVVFLGRIPHGFYEPQMRKYFRQFGSIQRLRLSRNKKTGASKHYAFIEFANNDVADIVAKTMQNYLMFGHILQCKKIPAEQVHPELFKGASERFKVDPRNKKAGKAMVNGTVRAKWAKRVAKENDKRIKEAKELKEEFGYEFIPPTLMDVDDVPKQVDTAAGAEQQLQLETPVADVTQVVESTPDHLTVTETVKVKKSNDAKGKAEAELETDGALETAQAALDAAPAVPAPKAKKNRKRKSDATVEVIEAAPVDVPAPKAKKARKAKA